MLDYAAATAESARKAAATPGTKFAPVARSRLESIIKETIQSS